MELGLSLGDPSKPHGFLKQNNSSPNHHQNPTKNMPLDFCMSLGIASRDREKSHKSDDDNDGDADDDGGDDASDDNQEETETEPENQTPLQLNLLPLAPVPRQISSHLWSSDNGSSENGSSGNMGNPAAKGLDVNRAPPPTEEVSSANSVGSPFPMDFSMYRNPLNGNLPLAGHKREFGGVGGAAAAAEAENDDDENAINTRKKLRLSKEQSAFLEESFKEHNTLNPVSPNPPLIHSFPQKNPIFFDFLLTFFFSIFLKQKQKLALAKQLNLRPRQVEVWFQNRRARTKLKQTEVDCEYLKRCCDTLTEENRRLHKELQELRALKSSNPFYMQLPATTLTMCPSCERVATAGGAAAAAPASAEPPSTSIPKAIPFPLTRPRFYPFSHQNQPAAS